MLARYLSLNDVDNTRTSLLLPKPTLIVFGLTSLAIPVNTISLSPLVNETVD